MIVDRRFRGAYCLHHQGWVPEDNSEHHTRRRENLTSSGRVISPYQRPLPTQYNTTYKHKRQTSMPRAGFEPAIPATKRTARPLGSAKTAYSQKWFLIRISLNMGALCPFPFITWRRRQSQSPKRCDFINFDDG
jgi:hypothetical protein